MDDGFDELSEALQDLIDLLSYQERVVYAREIGALAFAVDQVRTGTPDERALAWRKHRSDLDALRLQIRDVTDSTSTERERRIQRLRRQIDDLGIIGSLDAAPVANRGGTARTASADRAVDSAVLRMSVELDEKVRDLKAQTDSARQAKEELREAISTFAGDSTRAVEKKLAQMNNDAVEKFNRGAREEKLHADLWRLISLLIAFGGVALYLWLTFVRPPADPALTAAHLGVLAATGGLATFCGRHAAEHRRMQRDLRDQYLRWQFLLSLSETLDPKRLADRMIKEMGWPRERDPNDMRGAAIHPLPLLQRITQPPAARQPKAGQSRQQAEKAPRG
ncbi:hypothetical protein FHX75_1594 [Micromonospora palomenae]|uniref:Uncharacterized protein n=1 Tax=Micromonospora palomenae TaxID=1461247 RepID=A0A561VHA1_9ACTN|nr:hypothetical protein [Micromonospora palomenae]TWG11006.1 hypothetical protein FHX75_1594 [Micromonospora palomenae]